MKVAGGLVYVTGPMGSGKSLFGCRKIAGAIERGQYVITNIRLQENWSKRLALHTPQSWFGGYQKRKELYESLYIYEPDIEAATAYRIPGNKQARAVMVWDEVHNDMNNRDFMEDNRKYLVKWGSQLRKLGFTAYFLSQHRDNTDVAFRRIASFEVRLRNQREAVRLLGMRVCPVPFFLAIWTPSNIPTLNRKEHILYIERYFLSWHKKLYDTLELYSGLDEHLEDLYGAIMLPDPRNAPREELARIRDSIIERRGARERIAAERDARAAILEAASFPRSARPNGKRGGQGAPERIKTLPGALPFTTSDEPSRLPLVDQSKGGVNNDDGTRYDWYRGNEGEAANPNEGEYPDRAA